MKRGCLWAIGVVVVLAAIGSLNRGGGNNSTVSTQPSKQAEAPAAVNTETPPPVEATPVPTEEPVIKISAVNLYKAYNENELAADDKYKGNLLRVTGKVDNIDQGLFDSLYVTLNTGEFNIFNIQCFFDQSAKDSLLKLKKGSNATITGRCDGWSGNILLKDCEVG